MTQEEQMGTLGFISHPFGISVKAHSSNKDPMIQSACIIL